MNTSPKTGKNIKTIKLSVLFPVSNRNCYTIYNPSSNPSLCKRVCKKVQGKEVVNSEHKLYTHV